MIEAETIWQGFTTMAHAQGKSLCRFTIDAGMSTNSLCPSKYLSPLGKPRWPTVQTVLRACKTANMSLAEWAQMIETMQQAKDAE